MTPDLKGFQRKGIVSGLPNRCLSQLLGVQHLATAPIDFRKLLNGECGKKNPEVGSYNFYAFEC